MENKYIWNVSDILIIIFFLLYLKLNMFIFIIITIIKNRAYQNKSTLYNNTDFNIIKVIYSWNLELCIA